MSSPPEDSLIVNEDDANRTGHLAETESLGPSSSKLRASGVPTVVGNVQVGALIGRGGMGLVYYGWDSVLHRAVAVKFLPGVTLNPHDPACARFFDGARAEAALKQQNIVPVYEAGQVDGVPYLVMEYIDGASLRTLLRTKSPLQLAVALKVIWDVAEAIGMMHRRDIIHRDLKPANVLLDKEGHVLVTDFGLASLHRGAESYSPAGTPAYMAPEMFEGRASPQSDVYSLGIMLFELLSGCRPFEGNKAVLLDLHAHAPIPVDRIHDSIPASLLAVIERAAHKKEIFRYKTAEHFQRAVRDSVDIDELIGEGAKTLKALVFRLRELESADTRMTCAERTPTSSYFDRLGELAQTKREESPKRVELRDNARRPTSSELRPILIVDVLCVRCSYNLRGLPERALCPECAEPVESSLLADRLLFADRAWLERLLRGQKWIQNALMLSLGLPVVLFVATLIAAELAALNNEPDLVHSLFNHRLMIGLPLFLGIATTVGGVMLSTSREPMNHGSTRTFFLRCCSRLGAGATLVISLGLLSFPVDMQRNQLGALFVIASTIGNGALLASQLTVFSFLCYLSGLARRVPDRALGIRTRVLSILIPLASIGFTWVVLHDFDTLETDKYDTYLVWMAGLILRGVAPALMVGSILWFWIEMGSYRRLAARAISEHKSHEELLG